MFDRSYWLSLVFFWKTKTQLRTTEETIEAVKETSGTLQSTESNSQIGSLEDETAQQMQIDEMTKIS